MLVGAVRWSDLTANSMDRLTSQGFAGGSLRNKYPSLPEKSLQHVRELRRDLYPFIVIVPAAP
ncbi:MAG: hypothetical protein CV089_06095 [Nitrospira sp. WS110]|nr:hypothetical protein [Nitrospira sp. WS110]